MIIQSKLFTPQGCALKGKVPRYVAILPCVEEKNMVGSVERTKQLYGRVLQIHYEKAGKRADHFIDKRL